MSAPRRKLLEFIAGQASGKLTTKETAQRLFSATLRRKVAQARSCRKGHYNHWFSKEDQIRLEKHRETHAITTKIDRIISDAAYNAREIIEDKNSLYRGVALEEVEYLLEHDAIGVGPHDRSSKGTHTDTVEHVLKSNSRFLHSYATCFEEASSYAFKHLLPRPVAVVDARPAVVLNIPKVFSMCPELWETYDKMHQRGAHSPQDDQQRSSKDYSREEIACITHFEKNGIDIRPRIQNIPKVAIFHSGGFLRHIYASERLVDIVVNPNSVIYPWQVQVVGNQSELGLIHHYAHKEGRLDPTSRLLCLEDAEIIYSSLHKEHPEIPYSPNFPLAIIQSVPASMPIASQTLADYVAEQVQQWKKQVALEMSAQVFTPSIDARF